MRADGRLVEPLNDVVQKTGDDKALGDGNGNSARSQIKKLLFIDLTGGGAMRATDVAGQNFEAGHQVRFGVVAQEKIAAERFDKWESDIDAYRCRSFTRASINFSAL